MSMKPHQLQLHYAPFPKPTDGKKWVYNKQLIKQGHPFFVPLLHKIQLLRFEFRVLQTQFAENPMTELESQKENLITALILAETLHHQYEHYLVDKQEATYFKRQAISLKKLLQHLEYEFSDEIPAKPGVAQEQNISQFIRNNTSYFNIFRQIIFRSRKFIIELDHLVNSDSTSTNVGSINHAISPILNYFALLFFLPRTACNLWILGKHVLPGFWMGEKEKSLSCRDRLSFHLRQRGFEMGNDLVWCIVNISFCFVLVGPLAHWVFPILMVRQTYDVILRLSQLFVQIEPLIEIRDYYRSLLKEDNITSQSQKQIEEYIECLEKHIEYEKKQLILKALNSATILVIGVSTILLFGSCAPVATAGAGLIVFATPLFSALNQSLCKNNPNKPRVFADRAKPFSLFSNMNRGKSTIELNAKGNQPYNDMLDKKPEKPFNQLT